MSKIILFCGVESTGKTTAINNVCSYLRNKGKNVTVVSEYGRDVCEESGGVFEMSLLDYEKILYGHQSNILKTLNSADLILLDTDSLYTLHYLKKDKKRLSCNKSKYKFLLKLCSYIAKNNIKNNRISSVIYLNSDCEFVQDGTRTYQQTRIIDDKNLLFQYKKYYKTVNVVSGNDYNERTKQIYKFINEIL